jgi:hypothetical protein
MTVPTSNLADGNLKVAWVPAIANTSAPTVAELTAAGVVDLSSYLTADGFTPGGDEATVTDDRLSSTQTFERPGRHTDTLNLMYVYRQQEPGSATNKAFATLKRLTTGFIVSRWGADFDTAFAAGQIVDVMPAQCGKQMKQPPEANSVLKVGQRLFITGEMQRDVTVAA